MDEVARISILADIDKANSADPNKEEWMGVAHPKELLYGLRMSTWLMELCPDADDALRIAARGQHICRWEHPRSNYPMDRKGYLTWRRELYDFHAEKVADIMRSHKATEDEIERVSFLLHKKNLHNDPDTRTLEDAACLVFLEFHIADFAAKTDHEKMIGIIRKTWSKMSDQGRMHAMNLTLPDPVKVLLNEALNNA